MIRIATVRPCLLLASGLLMLGAAGSAEARQETLRWTHPQNSRVASFRIYVGSAPGASDLISQDVGLPTPDANGIYSFTVELDTEETIYVWSRAVGPTSLESEPSNEISRSVPLGMPGRPTLVAP
jgi:hypothetical protein